MCETRQLIIGNSGAGITAAEAIRKVDASCEITIVSAENCNAYSPVLETYYLKGSIRRQDVFITDETFYQSNRIDLIAGVRAVRIDTAAQVVALDDGRRVEYDNLLIATGASPMRIEGDRRLPNVLSLRTIADVDKILEHCASAREAVVVGAGLVGLQTAEALVAKGIKVTVVELADQLLPSTIDRECSAMLEKAIESREVTILLGEKVEGIDGAGRKAAVRLTSGIELTIDMVVVAAGVLPNVQLLEGSDIRLGRKGILVDETMRTNVPNVFASGDVCEGKELTSGRRMLLPTWPIACRQGSVAGLNMAGRKQEYEGGIAENIFTVFGVTVASVGSLQSPSTEPSKEVTFGDPARRIYRKAVFLQDRLIGALLMGSTADAGIFRNVIVNERDVETWTDDAIRTPLDRRKFVAAASADIAPALGRFGGM